MLDELNIDYDIGFILIDIKMLRILQKLAHHAEAGTGARRDVAEQSVREHIGELIESARSQWDETQKTVDLVMIALVQALDLMRERRKMPVFTLKTVRSDE